MLFPTIDFLIFFLLVFPVTWGLNKANTLKKVFLVFCSYVFYSFWDWHFLPILFFSSLFNFTVGLFLGRAKSAPLRKLILFGGVAGNLSLLTYYKYYDFLSAELQNLSHHFGANIDIGSTNTALPVAISFLTFHGLSYIIDVHRGKTTASKSVVDLTLYISFFPHLVAGPIVRAADFLGQLAVRSDPRKVELTSSMILILGGLFKKVIIASHLSTLFVDPIFSNPSDYSRIDLILAVYGYAIVIYCDFSAYTDIAIGIANLLGYRFPQNFNQPYRALSIQDFWRRWHMTLSSWLRDYLYIPLGGSRHGTLKTYRNLLLTMTIGGLWHGAGLQFLFWGFMHGVGLAVERALNEVVGSQPEERSRAARLLGWFLTFNFVCLAWIFFRSPDLHHAVDYLGRMVMGMGSKSIVNGLILTLMALGFMSQLTPLSIYEKLESLYEKASLGVKILVPTLAIWLIAVLAPSGIAPFIYFQF
ncbi:MAG: MBOAT family O-acyltransferase [Beijerinckiaceae bacterium]